MKNRTVGALFLALCWLASIVAASAEPALVVGSKRFTESDILGEIICQTATRGSGAHAVLKANLGNTGIVFNALQNGDIDVYPEYTGTIASDLLKTTGPQDLPSLNRGLARLHLAAGVPLGFNDTYALTMRTDEAKKLGIQTISDLARHPDLKLGFSAEFLKRQDGWPGLKAAYGLPFASPQGFDHGIAYIALTSGQIDVTDAYSTDAAIEKYHLTVLKDDRHFPEYDAVLLYRIDAPSTHPKAWAAIERLQNTIGDQQMIHMNAEVDLHGNSDSAVAGAFLSGSKTALPIQSSVLLAKIFAPDFWPLTVQHIQLVFISLAGACLVGIPLGIWAFERRRAATPILTTVGLIQTIPSLALFVFLIPLFHIGTGSALVALFLYSLLPIVRNTYTGLQDISPSLRESVEALGLPYLVRLRLVELPLATRSILGGIKTSAVINVGTATIAAFVGAGGYGQRISEGLSNYDTDTMLAGAIPAAVLALLVQGGFDLLDWTLTPKGLRSTRK